MNWKHILVTGLGAALPVVTTWLQGQPLLTLAELAKVLASAALVGFAAAMKGFESDPEVTKP
ncbi:MAG TPA: hypothetical protein VGJ79_08895 [Candidatus Dormibacteraeota bacterium]|jgi:hypothetical protein